MQLIEFIACNLNYTYEQNCTLKYARHILTVKKATRPRFF